MKQVLLVDDSEIVLDSLEKSLKQNYSVLRATNGVKGYDIAIGKNIDIFIVDYYMPYMDGLTLTEKLRETEKYKKTPIIILTSETNTDIRINAKKAGANGWIVKPCNMDKLLHVINKLIL